MGKYKKLQVATVSLQVRAGPLIRGPLVMEKKRAVALVVNWRSGRCALWPMLVGEDVDVAAVTLRDETLKAVAERYGLGDEVDSYVLMSGEMMEASLERDAGSLN